MTQCILCKRDVTDHPGWMLCENHWEEYKIKAKGDFREFQEFRQKIDQMFHDATIMD